MPVVESAPTPQEKEFSDSEQLAEELEQIPTRVTPDMPDSELLEPRPNIARTVDELNRIETADNSEMPAEEREDKAPEARKKSRKPRIRRPSKNGQAQASTSGAESPDGNAPAAPESRNDPEVRNDEKLSIHFTDRDRDIREQSIDRAERRLRNEIEQGDGGRFRKMVRRIWKGVYAHPVFRERYSREARDQLRQEYDSNPQAYRRANEALIDDVVTREAMGLNEGLEDQGVERMGDSPGEQMLQTEVRNLIRQYAGSDMSQEEFYEERTRLIDRVREEHPDLLDGAYAIADNMIRVAEQAKALAVDHNADIEKLVQEMEFYHDRTRAGVRTELQKTAADRVIEKLTHHKRLSWVNEATIATAVSMGYSIVKVASMRTVGSTLATVAPGIGGALFAGLRERYRVKEERTTHGRERSMGLDVSEGKRREEMERTMYEMRSATEMVTALESEGELTPDRAASLSQALGEALARQRVADERNTELFTFSAPDQVDIERRQLSDAMAIAQARLRAFYRDNPDQRERVGEGESFEQALNFQQRVQRETIAEDMHEKDNRFKWMRRKHVAKAAVKGALVGITLGLASQEVMSALSENLHGVIGKLTGRENINGSNSHQTFLRGLLGRVHGNEAKGAEFDNHHHFIEQVDSKNVVKVPHGYALMHDPEDHHSLSLVPYHAGEKPGQGYYVDNGKPLVSGLRMDSHHGGFDAQSQSRLDNLGVHMDSHARLIEHTHHEIRHTGVREFFRHNPKGTVHVQRQLWYDENTPAPVFDLNELRETWGGGGGTGLDSHGNIVMSMNNMTPDGSFHGNFSSNAQALFRSGQVKLLLSASHDTQMHPFEVKIDHNGNAIVDRESTVGRSLFKVENGKVEFTGRYAEIAQVVGHHGGREQVRILATVEGHGVKHITHEVTVKTHEKKLVTTVTVPPEKVPTDAPPVVPVVWRREMEDKEPAVIPPGPRPREASLAPVSGGIYGPEGRSPRYFLGVEDEEWQERWAEQRSPRLTEDSESILSPEEELSWYFDRQVEERGGAYIEELEKNLEQSGFEDLIDDHTRAFVCIPVAAAHETENIYNTLVQYAKQDKTALAMTAIALHVNWIDDADIPSVRKTLAEIERARKDFPDLKIAVFTSEYTRESVDDMDNKLYGPVTKELYDTAMLAMHKAHKGGTMSADQDAVLITNDADAKALSPHYLARFIETFENNSDRDLFFGRLKWDTASYDDYPGFAIAATAIEAIDTISRSPRFSSIQTPGANSAYRISTLAAVGGSNGDIGAGVDGELSRRIRAARSIGVDRDATSEQPYRGRVLGRKIGAYVPNAWIDTDADRMVAAYTNGEPVMSVWEQWNDAGYRPRPDLKASSKEDVKIEFDEIITRAEAQISSIMDGWEPELYTSAFNSIFRGENGQPGWEVGFTEAGVPEFHFTASGRKMVKRYLEDPRYGSYGARVRAIWHEGKPLLTRAHT